MVARAGGLDLSTQASLNRDFVSRRENTGHDGENPLGRVHGAKVLDVLEKDLHRQDAGLVRVVGFQDLFSMAERAKISHGRIAIGSSPGKEPTASMSLKMSAVCSVTLEVVCQLLGTVPET